MEYAYDALEKCFLFYILLSAVVLIVLVSAIKRAQTAKQGIRAIVIGTTLIVLLLVIVIPCGIDFLGHHIVQEQAIYHNYDQSKGHSGKLGIHSVILELENEETVKLTTVPSLEGAFPVGSFNVVAYYTQRSKLLLYIEVLGTT